MKTSIMFVKGVVLILVLMEYGLVQDGKKIYTYKEDIVLILVLMEYGLVLYEHEDAYLGWFGLNPCFNGIWSRTKAPYNFYLSTLVS